MVELKRVVGLLRDVVQFRGHIVLERLDGEAVLERVQYDVQTDRHTAKNREPDQIRVLKLTHCQVAIEVALDRHSCDRTRLLLQVPETDGASASKLPKVLAPLFFFFCDRSQIVVGGLCSAKLELEEVVFDHL